MQIKYAKICRNMHKNIQIYVKIWTQYANICKKISIKYANILYVFAYNCTPHFADVDLFFSILWKW